MGSEMCIRDRVRVGVRVKYSLEGDLLIDSLLSFNEARPGERSDRARFLPTGKKASSCRGAYRVPLFN